MGTDSKPDEDSSAWLSGNPTHFACLVNRYQAPLFRFAARIGFNSTEAEDYAQEVFLRVWAMRDRYDPLRARLSTWFWTLARNLALNRLQSSRRQAASIDDSGQLQPELIATDTPGPDEVLLTRDRLRQLDRAIEQLSASDRLVLALTYVDELSIADAAAISECSSGTYRVRLSRVRQRLIERINEASEERDVR